VSTALLLAAAGVVAGYVLDRPGIRDTGGAAYAIVAGACFLSALAIFARARRPAAWQSAWSLGLGTLGLAAVASTVAVLDRRGTAFTTPTPYDVALVLVAALFLIPVAYELRGHVPREDRREIAADVALISVALGTILYLLLRPGFPGTAVSASASAAEFAVIVAAIVSAYGALALWLPTVAHVGLFVAMCALSAGLLIFGDAWVRGTFRPGVAEIELPIALASLLVALLITTIPRLSDELRAMRPARYGRALLTTLSVTTACGALGLVATLEIDERLGPVHASALIGILLLGVVLRILVNQVRGAHAQRAVHEALNQKEVALRETDKALARLQRANETLRESEERLRTVFEAAVDGIIELDERDVILRANGAFCRMIELPNSLVEAQPWTALAASIEADESFASLPMTGQGTLRREGNAVYLESRTSEIPGDPPRRLLLVRDVTAARVADQTIRSLFKFLQDRDEDRTRIMRRTNAAIESERNRIARDLHDGPVQGVSAASLSLEAVLLMLKAGEMDEGIEVLSKVRRELSEEADNLRRLMSGLRPPLLEERGLIPALRENVDKYGNENHVRSEFVGRATVEIPQDLETLAYRIVQEALSNSTKHAKANRVAVSVEAIGGQLRIEVADDGVGFDSAKAREYLQMGRVGLASMRERVELANGTFMVHSTPGKGTTVLATLPLDAVPAPREFSVSEAS
jgi:PAS domain S-box-containing protein